ncbi:hypothetical protein DFQ28_006811 [Apophysomyces sp. BC1034]|nr:hypothetical protein DFQ30_006629 [Apophysomyces sp. BC1015]KAG0176831.1 hypothetical protein DFQ29_005576 [Apophysomyces sp. BC1021]KAG0187146.1 hypothetical protein DFQ28_006811 [Apophysomyces sp. BC1034]
MTRHTDNKHSLHPSYAKVCEQHEDGPSWASFEPAVLRATMDQATIALSLPRPKVHETELKITVEDRQLNVTILRPLGTENDIMPAILYIHGGGWVIGSKHSYAHFIHDLCVKSHIAVVFVEYSLSPEVKFPVPVDDCYGTLEWMVANHASIKINPDKIAVAGDSAGGNMSAVLSLLDKQRGLDAIKAQVLIYPAVSMVEEDFESYKLFGQGYYILSLDEMAYFKKAYFTDPLNELQDIRAAPYIATTEELAGLPPALVITAEYDVLRDEGEAYARKLTEAGVDATGIRVLGTIHSYVTQPLDTPQYHHTLGLIVNHVTRAFSQKK